MPRLPVAVIAAALLSSGCGGDGNEVADRPPQRTSEAPQTTATPAPTPDLGADKRIAAGALLSLDDFPSGWTENDDSGGAAGAYASCDAIVEAKDAATARQSSPDFANGETTQVENSVYVFADEATSQDAFDDITSRDTRKCLADGMAEVLSDREGLVVGEVSSARLGIDPLGDDREAARFTMPLSAEGVDADLHLDVVYVRTGRAIAFVTLSDLFTAFDDALREDLTGKVVRRLSAAVV